MLKDHSLINVFLPFCRALHHRTQVPVEEVHSRVMGRDEVQSVAGSTKWSHRKYNASCTIRIHLRLQMFNYLHLKERDREKIAFAKREKQSFLSKCITYIFLQQETWGIFNNENIVGEVLSYPVAWNQEARKKVLSSLLDVIVRRLFILRLLPAKITKHYTMISFISIIVHHFLYISCTHLIANVKWLWILVVGQCLVP